MVPAVSVALCLGGMDPSGGAGLLRDVMTVAGLGVHPMAVATAETVQNGLGCLAIHPPHDPRPALAALAPHFEGSWGVKLGLCALDPGILEELAAALEACGPAARIWDPVLAPTAGVGLHDGRALRAMAGILLGAGPWVVAPNLPEDAALAIWSGTVPAHLVYSPPVPATDGAMATGTVPLPVSIRRLLGE